jgi:hypothetical protein
MPANLEHYQEVFSDQASPAFISFLSKTQESEHAAPAGGNPTAAEGEAGQQPKLADFGPAQHHQECLGKGIRCCH